MKKIENTFTVTGFVGKDAEIRSFTSASVARFSLAVGRQEKSGDQTSRVSAFLNFEAWRKTRTKGLSTTWPKAPCLPWRAISSPKDGQTKTASSIIASRW